MTDLATQSHAGKASGDDAVDTEQDVDTEATATADFEPSDASDASDEQDAVTQADAVTADSDVPSAGTEVSPAVEAEADTAEPESAEEPEATDPEATEPGAEVEETEATDPETEEPGAEAEKTAATEPEAEETGATEPEAEDSDAEQPAAEEPDADEPESEVDTDDADGPEAEVDSDVPEVASENAPDADLETVAVATAVLAPAASLDVAPAPAVAPAPTTDFAPSTAPAETAADGTVYSWAPAEPKPKKKHTAIWISAAAGVAVLGLVVTSLLLIAPGTTVAGVAVGWMTPGAAAGAIEQRLAETTVVLTGDGGDVELTGAELGASVDAQALADAAFAEHPMWNPTAWFAQTGAEVEIDTPTAVESLQNAAPDLFTDPIDATVAFDTASTSYVSTPAASGSGVDVATVQQALQAAFEAGKASVNVDPVIAEIPAAISTETAADTATKLNGVLSNIGFYVGDERTVPVDPAVAASWITLDQGDDGAIIVDVDEQKIQSVVDTLPGLVNRDAVNATVVTNSAGKALPNPVSSGVEGRSLDSTDGIAAAFADQLAGGDGVYQLPVTATPFTTTNLARRIDVNLSTQRATLFENDQVVQSFVISSGAASTGTPTGNFTVYAYTSITDMGALCYNPNAVNSYCTEDVPWVTWFYPDIAFHGASAFRSSLGFPQSHGCVNMWDDAAKFIYDWSRVGTEVSVHN
ncbi:L,D-transpeptidase [Microbacterium sp. B35-04]|uniref:L,D-transpeptidase family protein n=1 Tax=Microbacterium sp. B35-04 TaxID=1961716 RepID=UPI001EF97C54|nr:L,D-transpeptidase [Microbacterium sp. B35-04]